MIVFINSSQFFDGFSMNLIEYLTADNASDDFLIIPAHQGITKKVQISYFHVNSVIVELSMYLFSTSAAINNIMNQSNRHSS